MKQFKCYSWLILSNESVSLESIKNIFDHSLRISDKTYYSGDNFFNFAEQYYMFTKTKSVN